MSQDDKYQKYSNEELEENTMTRKDVIDQWNESESETNDCPICKGKGSIRTIDSFETEWLEWCECRQKKQAQANARESGIQHAINKSKFEDYIAKEDWQKQIKERALAYANNPTRWLYISGQVGSGKTHLVLAIANELMLKGRNIRYFQWGKHNLELKGLVTEQEAYQREMAKYEQADVLVIDDFMRDHTPADIKIMYALINHRYNNNRITLFTSEHRIETITEKIDEAIGSRIEELAHGNIIQIAQGQNRNQRRLIK